MGAVETNAVTARSASVELKLIIEGGRKKGIERGEENKEEWFSKSASEV